MSTDDDNYDADRYDSEYKRDDDPGKIARDAYRRRHPEQSCFNGAFESLSANELPEAEVTRKKQQYLLGDLWRPGEVSVLLGETSVGKSIFAVQIAESIASGYGLAFFPRPRPSRVVYLDIEKSAAQFRDRYSCASNMRGRMPIRHQFPRRLERADFDQYAVVPGIFNGDVGRYMRHSIGLLFSQSKADIFVIDSLSRLLSSAAGESESRIWMRTFRALADNGNSVLVVAQSKPRRPHINTDARRPLPVFSPLTMKDIPRPIADLAHSVFVIGTSTMGRDIRYVKHLSSHSAQIYFGAEKVLTYRIERSPGVQAKTAAKPNADASSSQIFRIPAPGLSSLEPELTPMPYIGFDLIGMHHESDHLRDYPAEKSYIQRQEYLRQYPNRRPNPTIDMFLTTDYQKYLLGP